MKKYEIVKVSKADAWHDAKNECIGRVGTMKILYRYAWGYVGGWFMFDKVHGRYFYKIKLREIRERKAEKKKGKSKRFTATS